MILFKVNVEGDGMEMVISGDSTRVGFFKNHYVLAHSRSDASELALEAVKRAIKEQEQLGALKLFQARIAVTEVIESVNYLKLIFQEGFVFFRM